MSPRRATGDPARVALFASSFHPHVGGVEELVRQLAHHQVQSGIEPTVVTMRWPKSLPATERFEQLDVRRYVFRSPELPPRRVAAALGLGPVTLIQLVAELRRRRVELVHIQCVSPASWYAVQATRLLQIPLVVTLQGELTMDATALYERSAWARRCLRLVLDRADAVTACSGHTLAEAEAWHGRAFGRRGRVIHNGVDPTDFAGRAAQAGQPADAEPYVLGIGRQVPQKGFDVLIDAFAQLAERPDVRHRLVLAGDGPEHAALAARAAARGLADRVELVGATDRARTAALFRGADVFVLPSRHEPFGIVVLEALAAGTAVVASDVGGVAEFLPRGPLARLVAPDDPSALAGGLAAVLVERARHPATGPDAAETLRTHTWAHLEREYAEVYRTVLSGG